MPNKVIKMMISTEPPTPPTAKISWIEDNVPRRAVVQVEPEATPRATIARLVDEFSG